MTGVAINVGANTNAPGFRGPIRADGSFAFVPIPESEPTAEPVPTYADLPVETPADVADTPVHLDPEFAGYGPCERYTYGDPHGVKARPLLDLRAGDRVFFYATLSTAAEGADWIAPEWGAYIIGRFDLARDPIPGDAYPDLSPDTRAAFANNAHVKRETFDAAVLLLGADSSRLYDRAVPLSTPEDGSTANRLVTELSSDSGEGPWWRRPMRFDDEGVRELLALEGATDAELAAAV